MEHDGNAAKLAAIDSEIERIAVELEEYGVDVGDTMLGVGYTDAAKNRDEVNFGLILQKLVDTNVLVSFSSCDKNFKSKKLDVGTGFSRSAAKAYGKWKTKLSASVLAWPCIDSEQRQLYIFLKRNVAGSGLSICVCTSEILKSHDPDHFSFKTLGGMDAETVQSEVIDLIVNQITPLIQKPNAK